MLIISNCALAQNAIVYRMKMSVLEIAFDKSVTCKDTIEVIWGLKGDTIAFLYQDKELHYFPIDRSELNKDQRNKTLHRQLSLNQQNRKKEDFQILLNNHYLEHYWLRFVTNEYGQMMIFVTNVDYGRPSYIFSFGCNYCE